MRYFSTFTGIGGFELGFPSDWLCVGFSEVEPRAIEIYQRHFPSHRNFGDITKIDPSTIPDFDLLCGGFPCQAFSIAGNRRGFDDTRGTLFFDVARIARTKKPKYLLLENVRGLLTHDNGRTFEVILKTLAELGYDAEWGLFNSFDFGAAPRPRVYLFAMHRDGQTSLREGNLEALPLYANLCQRTRLEDYSAGEQESVRSAERVIRTFARLPDWLDSWDSIYGTEKSIGERSNSERSQVDCPPSAGE